MDQLSKVADTLQHIQFGENEATPQWAIPLVNCLKDLVDAVKEFNKLNERVVKLESVNEVRGKIIETLQAENVNLKEQINMVRNHADCNEQKSRTQCLLLHGIEELAAERTDDISIKAISEHLGVEISLDDIERSHRIGPPPKKSTRRTRPRAIVIRFMSMRKRMEVFRNKKRLKGKKILITESLTRYRYDLLKKSKTVYGERNVWSSDGRIFTNIDGVPTLIKCEDDLSQ